MFRGFSRSSYSRLYTWYWVVIWISVVYCAALSLFAANNLAIRLEVPGADRWKSWTFWRFFITSIAMVWPLFLVMLLMMFNTRRFLYTLHLWVGVIVAAWLGVFIAFMIVDWANCSNVAYCVSDNNSDHIDISFFFAFCAACVMFAINLVWLWWNRMLRNRTEVGQILAAAADPTRPDYCGGSFAGIFAPIGSSVENGASKDKERVPVSIDAFFHFMDRQDARTSGMYPPQQQVGISEDHSSNFKKFRYF